VTIVVRGLPEAVAEYDPALMAGRLEPAFAEFARELQAETRTLMGDHRVTGAAERSVEAEARGGSLSGLEARIESRDAAVGALAFGWHGRGTQPPVEPIARWLEARGKDPAGAFAVARTIGQRGLSFSPLQMFQRAWRQLEPRVGDIVTRTLGARR
jgi:hypothetical protein